MEELGVGGWGGGGWVLAGGQLPVILEQICWFTLMLLSFSYYVFW